MIERDDNIPALSELVAELAVARELAAAGTRGRRHDSCRCSCAELQRDMQRHLLGEESGVIAAIVDAPPLPARGSLGDLSQCLSGAADRGARRHLSGAACGARRRDLCRAGRSIRGRASLRAPLDSLVRTRACGFPGALPALRASSPFSRNSRCSNGRWRRCSTRRTREPMPRARARPPSTRRRGARLRFEFHPSLRRLRLQWNTAAVWQAMSHEETPPDPSAR